MPFRSWLAPVLALIRPALAAYRLNPRALVFAAACWLLFSGVAEFSPPAARIVLGAVFMVALLWPDRRPKASP